MVTGCSSHLAPPSVHQSFWCLSGCFYDAFMSSVLFPSSKKRFGSNWDGGPSDRLIFGGRKEKVDVVVSRFGVGVSVFHQTRRLLLWRNLEMRTASNGSSFPVQLFFASRMALSHLYFLSVKSRTPLKCACSSNKSFVFLRA